MNYLEDTSQCVQGMKKGTQQEQQQQLNRRQQRGSGLRAIQLSLVVAVAVVVVVTAAFAVAAVVVFDVFVVAIDIGAQMNFIKEGEQKPKRNCNKHCRQLKKLKADRASLHCGAESRTEECE